MAKQAISQLETSYKQQLKNFVTASSSINEYRALRGYIFEKIAHKILQKGGKFNIRLLEPDFKRSTIEIPERKKLSFNKICEIKEGVYCQPLKKSFVSVDAIVAPDALFRLTVSNNHPININDLKSHVNKLGGESGENTINFYFVLLKDKYGDFRKQRIHDGKTVLDSTPDWITNRFSSNMPWKLT